MPAFARSRISLLAVLVLSAAVAAAENSAPGRYQIIDSRAAGRTVQTITVAEGSPSSTPAANEPAGPLGRGDGEGYVWLDTNHLNAVAEEVAITGDGEYGIVGWWLNNKRAALYEIPGDNLPEWTRDMSLVDFKISVDADASGNALTATGRNDSLYVFSAASADPVRSHGYTAPRVGYGCAVSASGNTYVSVGGHPPGTAGGEIRVYDGSGTLRFKAPLSSNPEGVAVSRDGLVVAANTRTFVKVWDAMTGAQRDSLPIPSETQVASVLSGDGSVLVSGGFERRVRVYAWNGNDYVGAWTYLVPNTTWITALGISADGTTIAAGTWTSNDGGQVLLFDRGSSTPLWTDNRYGDWVSEVALTPDGGRIVAGSWGRYQGTYGPIINVYRRGSATPIFAVHDDAIAGVGSCFAVDISADGTSILAGGKAIHARDMGSGGWVMAIEVPGASDVAWDPARTSIAPAYRATPNPFRGTTRIELTATRNDTGGALQLYSADGRLVRTLRADPSARAWVWDGMDERGARVAAGAYFVRGEAAPGADRSDEAATRVVWVR
jgi:hypothetical protein